MVREILGNRRGFLLIRAQFVLHLAYSYLIRDRFFSLSQYFQICFCTSLCSVQDRGDLGRIQPNHANPPNRNCVLPVSYLSR